ncbi:MAG TPA: hypothetical protein VM658_17290 [bacterium]|nr:hypothetical protein [bacterium]
MAAAAAWLLALCNRGLNPADGAVQAFYGWEIAQGLTIYRDFFNPVAPAGYEIAALLERLFGHHLIVGRLYAAAQGLALVAAALAIGRRRLRYPFSLVPGIIYIAYTTALESFPHYNQDSIFFFIVALAFFDARLDRPRPWLTLAGALSASLSGCAKQSMAPAAVILTLTALYLANRNRPRRDADREALLAGLGLALPAAIFFARLAMDHALIEAWACMVGSGRMKNMLFLRFLPGAALLLILGLGLVRICIAVVRRRTALYLPLGLAIMGAGALAAAFMPAQVSGPLLCGLAALTLLLFVHPQAQAAPGGAFGRRGPWTLLRVSGILLFIAGVSSGLDFSHLLMAGVGASFFAGLFLQNLWGTSRASGAGPRILAGVSLTAVMAAGLYLDAAVPQLSYAQGPRWNDTAPIRLPGLTMMRTSPEQARELTQTIAWIEKNSGPDEKIFVYPWDLLIYYLSRRPAATYDTFLYFEIFDHDIAMRVIRDLDRNRPRIAVVKMEGDAIRHVAQTEEKLAIEGYLAANYDRGERLGNYQIMVRKAGK